jgi:pimeloyl-ACP methyl ester carboxylesterase
MPSPAERRGWSRLLAAVAAELVGTVHDVHRAGSDLAFRFVGPFGRPVKRVHDAVVDRSYRGVQLGCAGVGELGALVADRSRTAGHHASEVAHQALDPVADQASEVAHHVSEVAHHALDPVAHRAGAAVGAAAALAHHQLADRLGEDPAESLDLTSIWTAPWDVRARSMALGVLDERFFAIAPELDLELTLRHQGHEVAPDPASLQRTYPRATNRIAVFVHGLVHSEGSWFDGAEPGSSLPEVAASLGVTPVLVRYGTGRAIGRNGADLARLLDQVVAAWPVPVEELTIVGHSMGGLVARAAAVTASREAQRWTAALARVVYLGSPHLGSWLEKVANVTSWTLRRVSPTSAPIGRLLDGRSRGIKDLRFGTLLEEGWGGADIDDLLSGLAQDEPWLAGVDHHLIVGRLRPSERHLLNLVFGDSLVRAASAAGAGRVRRIAGDAQVSLIPLGASHVALSRHPEVASLLRTAWSA